MKTCQLCGEEYEALLVNDMCEDCHLLNETTTREIDSLISQGHPRHCACRQVWGDGECECDLYENGYDPYLWIKQSNLKNYREQG